MTEKSPTKSHRSKLKVRILGYFKLKVEVICSFNQSVPDFRGISMGMLSEIQWSVGQYSRWLCTGSGWNGADLLHSSLAAVARIA